MHTLNLGILAHVDAGKTSLTERLLYTAGVIDEIGSVDDGSTQTDSMELERQRGITIKSAVVSFAISGTTINLIDTPGHPDFIAEVERVLSVLDGAVLVVSAVEGVQAQTRVLMRALRRLRIPTLIFVNKIDRVGARDLLPELADKLTPSVAAVSTVSGFGSRAATVSPSSSGLVEVLADHDDDLLAAYIDDPARISSRHLADGLASQTRAALIHPVFFGSAITGAGVDALISALSTLLPFSSGEADGPLSGTVFKIERGTAGEKIAYVRMFSGAIRVRDRLTLSSGSSTEQPLDEREQRTVTGIGVFADGAAPRRDVVEAGQIAKVWGLGDVRIGDAIGKHVGAQHHFAPPTLETVVLPATDADRGHLHVALTQLAEQDPLINLRQDEIRQEISVSLYGEVQKEVIAATLANDFGVEVTFRETTTICIERLTGTGAAIERIAKDGNPFLAGIGLRVEPAPIGSGVRFRLGIELGSLPLAFITAIRETVYVTLRQGPHGWEIPDCVVTLWHSGYWPRQSHMHGTFDKSMSSTAGDFRFLTPLVLMEALREAGTVVCEPIHRFRVDIPGDSLGPLMPVLAGLRAVPLESMPRGSAYAVEGDIPADRVHDLERALPALTRGEGVVESAFDHYREVTGAPPTRSRTDHNPCNRKEYLIHVVRRV